MFPNESPIRQNIRVNTTTGELELLGGGAQLQFDKDSSNDPSGINSEAFSYDFSTLNQYSYTLIAEGYIPETFNVDNFTSTCMALIVGTKRMNEETPPAPKASGLEGGFRIYNDNGTLKVLSQQDRLGETLTTALATAPEIETGDKFEIRVTISDATSDDSTKKYQMETELYINGTSVLSYDSGATSPANEQNCNIGYPETLYLTMFGPYGSVETSNDYVGNGDMYMALTSVELQKKGI